MLAAAMGLTVFLVDDEGQILRLLTRVLTRAGHTVIAAEDGDEALKTFGQHAADIDVMVLDVVIPPRGGAEVLDAALERRPGLPFIMISGEAIDGDLQARIEAGKGSFLRKPFHPDTVLEALGLIEAGGSAQD